jgi:uncharacterized protein YbbC (DUF1343 family)
LKIIIYNKMTKSTLKLFSLIFVCLVCAFIQSCSVKGEKQAGTFILESMDTQKQIIKTIQPGAEQLAQYVPTIKNKKVGLVVNHTSRVGERHLVDTLLSLEINIVKLFSPEHGFTGMADAGEKIEDGQRDTIPIVSLYGKKRMPSGSDLEDLDVVVFDIQDAGVRFYTYISTLHYVMEACAENGIPVIVLDRPNPNGHYVDGPLLESAFQSFVGMHPIPVVYGMTIGELALMINGEAWLKNGVECDLTVIRNVNYTHLSHYVLPIPPSPNLPDQLAVTLYPSLCFFEGTPVSVGRGTDGPFTRLGHPAFTDLPFQFTPVPNAGASHPKLIGQSCFGYDFSGISLDDFRAKGMLELRWLLEFHDRWKEEAPFFNADGWFDQLAGTAQLRKMIEAGKSQDEIRASWQPDLTHFKAMRKDYLLYEDFE